MGKPVQVFIRTAEEMAGVLERNPFSREPGNRVPSFFTDAPLASDPTSGVTGQKTEQLALGKRELFIFYPDGMEHHGSGFPPRKPAPHAISIPWQNWPKWPPRFKYPGQLLMI